MAARLIFVRAAISAKLTRGSGLDPVNMSASGYDPEMAEAIASSTVSASERNHDDVTLLERNGRVIATRLIEAGLEIVGLGSRPDAMILNS